MSSGAGRRRDQSGEPSEPKPPLATSLRHWRRAAGDGQVAADAGQSGSGRISGGVRRSLFKAHRARLTNSIKRSRPWRSLRTSDMVQRQAFAGLLWGKQFYHYNVRRWLRGDPAGPEPPRRASTRAQQRLDAPQQRRRDFHAGQVGVPLVCGLGSCLPLHPAGADRSGFRQRTASSAAARMVHASQWATSGLRMELLRCESSGSRLGGVARLQDRGEDIPGAGTAASWNVPFISCFSISLGG